jgi:hypothetical protein
LRALLALAAACSVMRDATLRKDARASRARLCCRIFQYDFTA